MLGAEYTGFGNNLMSDDDMLAGLTWTVVGSQTIGWSDRQPISMRMRFFVAAHEQIGHVVRS